MSKTSKWLWWLGIGLLPFPLLIAPAFAQALGCVTEECEIQVNSNALAKKEGAVEYASGGLTRAKFIALIRYVKFPQSYDAMIERFGYPQLRSPLHDFYRMPNGQLVGVRYQGTTAVSLTFR